MVLPNIISQQRGILAMYLIPEILLVVLQVLEELLYTHEPMLQLA